MRRSGTYKYWIEIVIWMGFIFWMSTTTFSAENTGKIIEPLFRFLIPSISHDALETIHTIIRKCAHLTEYTILGILCFRALYNSGIPMSLLKTAALALLIVALFAATDEFHQIYVSTRTPSPVDVAIDTMGGFIGQCITYLWIRRRRPRELSKA